MKVAVVGCGYWGKNLVRNFARLGGLAMVCDETPVGRAMARDIVGDVPVVDTFDEVLASDVAGVALATPAETHYALARRALEAGKDVFVEKPLALKAEQGSELVELADRRERMLMVGHVLEYHPAVVTLIRMVRDGALGRVRYIYSNRLSLGKVRREENILWSFAPHDIAVILRLLGSEPIEVSATGGNYLQPTIADVTVSHLRFAQGVRAHIFVSWLHPFKEQRLVVVGDRRMASFDDVGKRLVVYDQRVEFDADGVPLAPVRHDGEEVAFSAAEPLEIECRAFLEAMATRTPPLADGASGVRVLRVLEASQRSLAQHGAPVPLVPHAAAVASGAGSR